MTACPETLAVQFHDGVGDAQQTPDLRRECEHWNALLSGAPPVGHHRWIALPLAPLKLVWAPGHGLPARNAVYGPHVAGHPPPFIVRAQTQPVPHQVHDTGLHLKLREHTAERLGEALAGHPLPRPARPLYLLRDA